MTIYCSKKLEEFLGTIRVEPTRAEDSVIGGWNGHLFMVNRKKCLIFMNNRSCYLMVMADVQKKHFKNFSDYFKERLIRQLEHDLDLTEGAEVRLRNDLRNIVLCKSNNDKKIIGTINHQVEALQYPGYQGGIENWDEVIISGNLNSYPVLTKIFPDRKKRRDYFIPLDVMRSILQL